MLESLSQAGIVNSPRSRRRTSSRNARRRDSSRESDGRPSNARARRERIDPRVRDCIDRVLSGARGGFRRDGSEILEQAATVVRDAGVPFERRMIEKIGARASDEIVALAKEWPADLIVLGTHGRRGLNRLVMGSDAEQVCWFEIKSRIEDRARLD